MASDWSRYLVDPGPKPVARDLTAAVSTDSAIVTEAILDVLGRGGNAADAAVAGALVQAAVEPYMTNHAGLVTCLYYEAATNRIHQLDSLGGFPSGLPPFRPVPQGNGPYSTIPPSAIIPGFMPGLRELYHRFGTLPWQDLCESAVRWAETGHPVSSFEYGVTAHNEKFYAYFPEGREFYFGSGGYPGVGKTFVPKGLAKTLAGVAAHGPDYMITGPWAEAFVSKANEMGWRIRPEHMTETPPKWLEPIRFKYNEYEVVSLGPPQVQGLFLGLVLGVLKHLGIRDMKPGSAEHLWAMGHALRQGARHWEFSQDEAIYDVPKDEVLDDAYHAHLARLIKGSRPKVDLSEHIRLSDAVAKPTDVMAAIAGVGSRPRLGNPETDQPTGSCEFAVADARGNWIQIMNTLQGSGIPGMVVGGVPMVGSHASFGGLMTPMDATLVKGARGRSVIGNTFVLKDGRPVLSVGTPGNVHCTIPQVLTNILDFKLDPYAAVEAPRMLPMNEAREITVEDRLRPGVVEDLHRLGIRVSVLKGYDYHMGGFAVIAKDELSARYTAVTDPRRCGVANGFQ